MYCAVTRSSNTVSVPSVSVSVSLVQVTEVAGPPVEIQVRVNWGMVVLRLESTANVIPPDIVISPGKRSNIYNPRMIAWQHTLYYCLHHENANIIVMRANKQLFGTTLS